MQNAKAYAPTMGNARFAVVRVGTCPHSAPLQHCCTVAQASCLPCRTVLTWQRAVAGRMLLGRRDQACAAQVA